jgi:hypothetical protein
MMAWRIGGGRKKDEVKDVPPQKETRLTGKDLERAQELVKEMIKAELEIVERYPATPDLFPDKR